MRTSKALTFLLVSAFATAALAGCMNTTPESGGQSKIVIAIQPTQDKAKLDNATLLEQFLENRTGVDVEIFTPKDNAAVIEAIRGRHADVAFMGALPAALAVTKGNGELALAEMRAVIINGSNTVAPYYYSNYVVLKDSEYQNFSELRGKKVAYTSSTSTSG
ncbi:MAG TPA: PhnD/SsuA/transferrin family substrate-binding protein, partial [Candidatus Thermoplasmatota archaeon]|nr:PhnD/SsuA/transferrin family substrate-binding protein [Candidatus Thermoplasmatota archaeon]